MSDDIKEIRYRVSLLLSAIKNLLEQNNKNGVNDYLISVIDREQKRG